MVRHLICTEGDVICFWDRVRLTVSYGWVLLVCGALFNIASGVLLATSLGYSGIDISLLFKLLCTGVLLYLQRQFEHRDAVFFYINLGLTRRRMLAEAVAMDYLAWALMIIIIVIAK